MIEYSGRYLIFRQPKLKCKSALLNLNVIGDRKGFGVLRAGGNVCLEKGESELIGLVTNKNLAVLGMNLPLSCSSHTACDAHMFD
jgi:hypothetical protein